MTGALEGLGYVTGALGLILSLAIAIVGLVVVRPAHATAGLVLAGGAGARFLGLVLSKLLGFTRDAAGLTRETYGVLNALLSLGMSLLFWGSIGAAAWMLAQELNARGGRRS
ncbi:hypothetical protein [Polyangium aurulentum]|uniref:hypothetical protein n=1 Tax=Polyangium aurulentum TaxID=2567896 RepID=UPI0010ADC344|nr:hypothetical protein [Polyangium aurulentum]UQA61109.1 hypothetical protein E8A73_011770 [Polyangium aurulentum]